MNLEIPVNVMTQEKKFINTKLTQKISSVNIDKNNQLENITEENTCFMMATKQKVKYLTINLTRLTGKKL